MTPWPSRAQRLGAARPSRRDRCRAIGEQRRVADRDPPAVDRADHALAGLDCEVVGRGEREAALLGARRRSRRRAGARCRARGWRPAAAARSRRCRRAASTATSRGLPSVRVPVLSTTSVSTFSSSSSASAFLTSTPARAPRPVPTMIDIGVARPSAHGQAMISTATALTSAKPIAGAGPKIAQTTNAATATSDHRRHEPAGDDVGELLDRRARALRLGDHADDLRQQRVAADPLGPHHKAAGRVDRARRSPCRRPPSRPAAARR